MGLNNGTRIEWDAHDLLCMNGLKLEVKSAAYLQSWKQPKYSRISFDIAPKRSWNAETAESSETCRRPAAMYVFCLLHHQDKNTIDALDLSQWTFYVLKTAILDQRLPTQKQIALSSLIKLSPRICTFDDLRATIEMKS